MIEGYNAAAAREYVKEHILKDARFVSRTVDGLDRLIETMQKVDIEYTETCIDGYYDDEEAFDRLVDAVCTPNISDAEEMLLCELCDAYLTYHQDHLEEAGLIEWE